MGIESESSLVRICPFSVRRPTAAAVVAVEGVAVEGVAVSKISCDQTVRAHTTLPMRELLPGPPENMMRYNREVYREMGES